jgi:protein-disulfide isomerase
LLIRFAPSTLVVAACLVVSPTASAQSPAELQTIKQELQALRAAQDAMAKDLEAIKTLLQQPMGPRVAPTGAAPGAMPAGTVAALKIGGRPTKGSPTAKVTLVEYSDYESPFCGQYAAKVYPDIDREYVKTSKIRYVFKNYPIEQLHQRAFQAHVAAACAGDQGQYWGMHDRLFADQANLHLDRFVEHAVALGVDAAVFRKCVQGSSHEAMIREDINEALQGGVRGTPVFVLALTNPKSDTVTPARVIVGAQPLQAFTEAIEALLAQAEARPKP